MLRVLVGTDEDGAELASPAAGLELPIAAPKEAGSGDRAVVFIPEQGFVAFGEVLAAPSFGALGRRTCYRTTVGKIEPLARPWPLAEVAKRIPGWRWASHPRSSCTPAGDVAEKLLAVLAEEAPDIGDEPAGDAGEGAGGGVAEAKPPRPLRGARGPSFKKPTEPLASGPIHKAAAAAGTSVAAVTGAEVLLGGGHSAVDAVIAGFFSAAGADPGVLLSPAVMLVAGFGSGARVFDGRAVQPGLGAARPRGFINESEITKGARVAAPRSVGMLLLAHGYRGRASLSEVLRPGVYAAREAEAEDRARLLHRIGSTGVLALRAPEVASLLINAAGPLAGGALSSGDLEQPVTAELDATATEVDETTRVYTSPLPAPEAKPKDRVVEAVVACDSRGGLAAIVYTRVTEGVGVPELELLLGADAEPVRRGVTRLAIGTPRLAPSPFAALTRSPGFSAVLAIPGAATIAPASLSPLSDGLAAERALAQICSANNGSGALAVVTDGRTARAIRA